MIYYGSDMEIKVHSRCDYADDMQILNDFRELSKKYVKSMMLKLKLAKNSIL